MKIIAIMNQKGGVGKTTVTVNFAAGLARAGRKVLIIDADLQANTTIAFGVEVKYKNDSACDLLSVLTHTCKIEESLLIRPIQVKNKMSQIFIIPATIALSGFDQAVRAIPAKQLLLKQLLFEIEGDYDYVLIDCPPSLGLMTINALVAAHEVFIPVQPEFFALQGISQLLDTVKLLQKNLNTGLKIGGVLCTRFNRRKIHQEVLSCLEERFKTTLFATKIHENIAIAEAPSFGKTIFEYSPQSNGAYDFDLLIKEFLNREVRQMTIPTLQQVFKQVEK
ncbi:ParA family protein [Candidatus Dependentiae bacterium]|nr:ParA family protein [Candidatus Dependentiae bacterium]